MQAVVSVLPPGNFLRSLTENWNAAQGAVQAAPVGSRQSPR